MSSVFFVASFIFVPIPPSSAHLVLGGVIGLLLGWAAFPAILVAFVLQSLYGFGGITTLGANTINVALPAVICHYLFIPFVKRAKTQKVIFILGTMAGSFAVLLTTLMLCVTLHFSGESGEFDKAAMLLLGAHVPLMIAEGAITGFAVSFLDRVRPQLFGRQQYGEGV
jgi:cobalt/nickel transport system permease protein